jgi:prepilin-type N-terminal cleavage/methylation domain-containing protein
MKKIIKHYFTLPEVTMAIAILAIGLLSILGVFPVAIKSGLQAVKISESIHKARAVANLYQTFALKAPAVEPLPYTIPIDSDAYKFAFTDPDNLKGGAGTTFEIPIKAVTRLGEDILDANGNTIPGLKVVIPDFLNGKFQLDRTWLTVNNEFDTYFYLIRSK